jgi:hypothetical protein
LPASLPTTFARRPHPRFARACTAALLLLLAGTAWALDVRVSTPRARGTLLVVNTRIDDLLDARVRNSLERGMPATLELHPELWRRRAAWFDKLEDAGQVYAVRVHYEVWDGAWRVERPGAAAERFTSVDSVARYLERPWAVALTEVKNLRFGTTYYAVVNVTLRPVSAEDVSEVEGWLAGRGGMGGLGVITELPRSLFDAVRNVAGFGDRRARAITRPFIPDTLETSER